MVKRGEHSTTMPKWQNREIALGKRMKSIGEPVAALAGHLAKQDVHHLTAVIIIRQAYNLTLSEARDAYELHPLVRPKWVVQRCKRFIAEGTDEVEIHRKLRLSGYSDEEIDRGLRNCADGT